MERPYLSIIYRWLWLLLLAALAAGGVAYWIARQQPPVYAATVRLIVGPGIDSPNPDLNALRAGGQLMQTYAELPNTDPFLLAIIDELELAITPDQLNELIDVQADQETQILTIRVEGDDPRQAVFIANAAARTLVSISPSNAESAAFQLDEQMRNQATRLEQNIVTIEERIGRLEEEFRSTTDPAQQSILMDNLSAERDRLSDTHSTLAQLYESLQAAATNRVKIIEPANSAVLEPSPIWLQALIGGLVGLGLCLTVVMSYEYLTNTLNGVEDLERVTEAPVLGAIAGHRRLRGSGRQRLVVQALADTAAAESYRLLGTKLMFASDYRPPGSVLFSSAQHSADAGEVAANLGVVLAQTGKRVALVDANLHHPTLAELFGIGSHYGLTDVLTGQAKVPQLTTINWATGLSVLPSGSVTPNAFALLASPRMGNFLTELENHVDILLVVASPLLWFADSLFLASRADGVILVARRGETRRDTVSEAIGSLRLIGARVVGTILTNGPPAGVRPAGMARGPVMEPAEDYRPAGVARPAETLAGTQPTRPVE